EGRDLLPLPLRYGDLPQGEVALHPVLPQGDGHVVEEWVIGAPGPEVLRLDQHRRLTLLVRPLLGDDLPRLPHHDVRALRPVRPDLETDRFLVVEGGKAE